jgi:NAD(P)-dependent dehydrogenase (short-subunit alcohol dehydrogenase family)
MAGQNKNNRMWRYLKAAVEHLTSNMVFDLGPDKIRVNAIAPGAIRTAALATVLTPDVEAMSLSFSDPGVLCKRGPLLGKEMVILVSDFTLAARCSSFRVAAFWHVVKASS